MKISEKLNKEFKGDPVLWIVLILLGLSSLLAIYSTTNVMAYKWQGANTEYYLVKHFIFLLAGMALAYIFHLIKYTRYSTFAAPLLIVSIVLLVLVLLFGNETNGAKRWLALPFGLSFQPSDLAELALMIYLAKIISAGQTMIKENKKVFWHLMIPVIVLCGLILPYNLSTAVILFLTSILVMFIGRVPVKYIGYIFLFGAIGFGAVWMMGKAFPNTTRVQTWTERINKYQSGELSFQAEQARIAIANGGIFGVGPGNSVQRNFVPYAHADFIYAIIIEEFGWFGALGIPLLYLWMLYRCIRIVSKSPKTFGAMLSVGLCLNIVMQAFSNIMVTVGLFPDTGVTLPIISLGGTSLIFTCIAFGIILSVSKYIEQFTRVESAVIQEENLKPV